MYRAHCQWCETVLFITKNITQWFNKPIRDMIGITSTQFLSSGAFDEIDLRFEQTNCSRFAIRRSSNADGDLRIYGSMLTAWLKVRADLCFHCCEISSNVLHPREQEREQCWNGAAPGILCWKHDQRNHISSRERQTQRTFISRHARNILSCVACDSAHCEKVIP